MPAYSWQPPARRKATLTDWLAAASLQEIVLATGYELFGKREPVKLRYEAMLTELTTRLHMCRLRQQRLEPRERELLEAFCSDFQEAASPGLELRFRVTPVGVELDNPLGPQFIL